MDQSAQKEMQKVLLEKIEETQQEIAHLQEVTQPIKPDNAYGRLSRMDAINNKSINDAALRENKSRLQKLRRAQERLEEGTYRKCLKCGENIPLGRLKFMPWTTKCVKCA